MVVSVGNLSVGGTGKTPTVENLAKFFSSKGIKTAVLLRGYKRKGRGPLLVSVGKGPLVDVSLSGDEAYLYAERLKGVAVAVAEKRCEGVKLLERAFKPQLILLDDAFQHLAIKRDFDIVLLTPRDLEEGVIPFGRLREPLEALRRADYCLLSKTEGPNPKLEALCGKLKKPFGYLRTVGYKLLNSEGKPIPFETLKGKTVGVVSAVGDNRGFQNAVGKLADEYGFRIGKILSFRDHHPYRGNELDPSLPWITTFKDFYKLREKTGAKLLVLEREMELPPDLLRSLERLFK